jgi:ABC-type Mn2+/Zn2+ transport system ATPase subunit
MAYHRLEIKDLTVSYKRVPAVHHVSLELKCGSCVGLLGPNGAGKTSLFKALVGLVPLETGSMSFHGDSRRLAYSEIAYLPSATVDWDFPITVQGMVEMDDKRWDGGNDFREEIGSGGSRPGSDGTCQPRHRKSAPSGGRQQRQRLVHSRKRSFFH